MKKIYCLSLLLCANAMIFACQEQQIKQQRQELKKSPIQGKKNSPIHNEENLGSFNRKEYCRNRQVDNTFSYPFYDFPGQNYFPRSGH